MPHAEFLTFTQNENIAITKANILYSQKTKGFCPELLDSIYTERVENQKQLKKLKIYRKTLKTKLQKLQEKLKNEP